MSCMPSDDVPEVLDDMIIDGNNEADGGELGYAQSEVDLDRVPQMLGEDGTLFGQA